MLDEIKEAAAGNVVGYEIDDNSIEGAGIEDTGIDDTGIEDRSIKDAGIKDTGLEESSKVKRVAEPVEPSQEQINFKAIRAAKKQVERERDEFKKRLDEMESARVNPEEDEDLYDDDISKTRKEVKELKQQWSAYTNQTKTASIEKSLKDQFPDLESVVNEDNIDVLKARDPNFAALIANPPSDPSELYNRAVSAYALIKKYGIYVEDTHKKDRAKVEKNMSKPRPASTAATSSPSEGLTDFAEFAGMDEDRRRRAIYELALKRANS